MRTVDALIPRPREARSGSEMWAPGDSIALLGQGPSNFLNPARNKIVSGLKALGIESPRLDGDRRDGSTADTIKLVLDPNSAGTPQSYRLQISPRGVEISAADGPGLFYGACTLVQWVRAFRPDTVAPLGVPALDVSDQPDLPVRGFMLDISRSRVPTMQTLFDLVDLIAECKLNQLQLYTEHTFAYPGHEVVWRGASPMTPQEVRKLDAYCAARWIELVPNQNSFGHLHRWLVHEPYRRLAECPDGIQHAFSDAVEPFSLCPTDPRSLQFLTGLYDELLPNFSSRWVNVGLDETFDLGKGRSASQCTREGKHSVYLDFLGEIHGRLAERGSRMMFWGDIVLERPDLIDRIPGDALPLIWGYEANHPFPAQVEAISRSGLEFYVCPGTSSWNSLGGRSRNALENLASAATSGLEGGASGYLITDWGDNGHLQPLPVSYPALLAGAAFSWNNSSANAPRELPVGDLIDLHVYAGQARGLGQLLMDLGRVESATGVDSYNGSVLFYLLKFADQTLEAPRFENLTRAGLEAAREKLAGIRERLAEIRPAAASAQTPAVLDTVVETTWVAKTLDLACRLGMERLSNSRAAPTTELAHGVRSQLAATLDKLLDEYPEIWSRRSRPGGLQESTRILDRLRALLG